MLHRGDLVGLCGCSDGRSQRERPLLEQLEKTLERMGLNVVAADHLYAGDETPFSAPPRRRAAELTALLTDGAVTAVFDVSGGDGASGVLEYLDWKRLAACPKPFWGYSDLTALLNPLRERSGMDTCLYQIKNLVLDPSGRQLADFQETVMGGGEDLYQIQWHFLQGSAMEGTVMGGNTRCLLKLAGTPWFPDLRGKLLFLESLGGGPARIEAYLRQLRQMGIFGQISGLLLGTFTELERKSGGPSLEELVLEVVEDPSLPVARTNQVGHGVDSKCLRLGKYYDIAGASD